MPLKSLAALVLVLVSLVLASTHCYLAADRAMHAGAAAFRAECCNTLFPLHCDLSGNCSGDAVSLAPRELRRTSPRLPLASRRRDSSHAGTWTTPAAGETASTSSPRGS